MWGGGGQAEEPRLPFRRPPPPPRGTAEPWPVHAPAAQVITLIVQFPLVVGYKLNVRFQDLLESGFSREQIIAMACERPELLSFEIKPSMFMLETAGFTNREAVAIAMRFPQMIGRDIAMRVKQLLACFSIVDSVAAVVTGLPLPEATKKIVGYAQVQCALCCCMSSKPLLLLRALPSMGRTSVTPQINPPPALHTFAHREARGGKGRDGAGAPPALTRYPPDRPFARASRALKGRRPQQ